MHKGLWDWFADKLTWSLTTRQKSALIKLDDSDLPGVSLNKDP